MAGPTRAELSKVIDDQREKIMELKALEGNYLWEIEQLRAEREHMAQRLHEEQDYTQVLMGDRDRLTAALELCTRRLASPSAERLLARAGWRANNLIGGAVAVGGGMPYENLKSEAPRNWTPRH